MDPWLLCVCVGGGGRGGLQERGIPGTGLPRESGAPFLGGVGAWAPFLPHLAYSSTKG